MFVLDIKLHVPYYMYVNEILQLEKYCKHELHVSVHVHVQVDVCSECTSFSKLCEMHRDIMLDRQSMVDFTI